MISVFERQEKGKMVLGIRTRSMIKNILRLKPSFDWRLSEGRAMNASHYKPDAHMSMETKHFRQFHHSSSPSSIDSIEFSHLFILGIIKARWWRWSVDGESTFLLPLLSSNKYEIWKIVSRVWNGLSCKINPWKINIGKCDDEMEHEWLRFIDERQNIFFLLSAISRSFCFTYLQPDTSRSSPLNIQNA